MMQSDLSDLSDLPSDEIRSALCEVVENKLKSKNYQIHVTSASKAGQNNFMGIVQRVSFNKTDETESDKNQTKLILKTAPQNAARRATFFTRRVFLREIHMYEEVLPYFRQFEQSKGVTGENGFIEYPKCYRTVDVEPSECVFLEDLSVKGFSIIDRFNEEVTAEHVQLIMQCLGKFHAISFALKDQQPDKFVELAAPLTEVFIRSDDAFMRDYFSKQMDVVYKAVDGDNHLTEKLKKLFEKEPFDIALECLNLESTGGASVISHGDAWQNNTMFRYDNSGKPIEISLLDWQVSRHSSPIIDIVYFMFCCTTKELREAHYEHFLNVYHESLSAQVRRLGSDPDKLFSYNMMQEHFRKYAKFGLILATALLPMITSDDSNTIDLDDMALKVENGVEIEAADAFISDKSRSKFDKRLRDVITDMERFEYI